MNAEGRREATAHDISRAIMLLWRAWSAILLLAAMAGVIALGT